MSDTTIVINLALALFFGGLIGWFREKEKKTAGMRTHILVCLGSALFMIVSINMLQLASNADPGRIAAGVVTGIGFIGAGTIVQTRGGVRGITTAACIWVTSAIGICAGASLYTTATAGTILTVAALQIIREVEVRLLKTKEE